MQQKEIIEGNKLISEFMGFDIADNTQYVLDRDRFTGDCIEKSIPGTVDDLQYHTSWDWLMPVVEKIESSADQKTGHIEVHINENNCSLYQFSYTKPIIKTFDGGSKISAVWQAVVQFIQWYNIQSPLKINSK